MYIFSMVKICLARTFFLMKSAVENNLVFVLFTGAALYALTSVLLISNKFWDWTGPVRGRAGPALNGPWSRLCPVQ